MQHLWTDSQGDLGDDDEQFPSDESAAGVLPEHGHEPVLVQECLLALGLDRDQPARVVVDCTTGRGGHAAMIAARLRPIDTLVCLDADPTNLAYAKSRIASTSPGCTIHVVHENFSQLTWVLKRLKIDAVDGLLADLGLSTNQILAGKTGLSFNSDDPLDMRIDPRTPLTAAAIVNTWPQNEIADLIYHLADERYSRRIARKIIEARGVTPILTSRRLAEVVRQAVPPVRRNSGRAAGRGGRHKRQRRSTESIDPATRTFLALRMKVNCESENLRALLTQAPELLKPGGILAVISFQSTEDRIVKHTLIELSQAGQMDIVTRKPIGPCEAEVAANPRSRSARLRVARKAHPP